MKQVATAILVTDESELSRTMAARVQAGHVGPLAVVGNHEPHQKPAGSTFIHAESLWSTAAVKELLRWFQSTSAEFLCLMHDRGPQLFAAGLRRMVEAASDSGAALVYGDYMESTPDGAMRAHPLVDYQRGSIRDDFDLGLVWLMSRKALLQVQDSLADAASPLTFGALYDLRLRLSERGALVRLPEPLYQVAARDERTLTQKMFDYVNPKNRDYQIEMERVATAHLKRIGAFLTPPNSPLVCDDTNYPCRATVIIPVRNRVGTVADAVRSALSQETKFDFNVIVVDNHSTDGTTAALADIAKKDKRLHHIIPSRFDLGIGGCWNEAVYSPLCGRIAAQLDSDDLYDGTGILQRIVDEFDRKPYAMVIGSYTTVSFDLKPLPPGLIDHREWSDDNGMNNALRISGLGAPRAYHVPTLRSFGFPNVSYGEDYAAVLRLTRSYPVGRIYESLYWCRRWEGNTDSSLSLEMKNRYDVYKDRLRSLEIDARRQLIGSKNKK